MSTNEAGSTGESDLLTLIAQMAPSLDDQVWAFVSIDQVSSEYVAEHALATFREAEGTTLIVPWERAEEFDVCSEPMARITLSVHSGLEAVGLTAAVSRVLAIVPCLASRAINIQCSKSIRIWINRTCIT